MTSVKYIITRFKKSDLIKDSFYAVFGNGIENALMLFAGIIIALKINIWDTRI